MSGQSEVVRGSASDERSGLDLRIGPQCAVILMTIAAISAAIVLIALL